MKELLTYIVQSLVDHPDEVSVTEREADGEFVYEVSTDTTCGLWGSQIPLSRFLGGNAEQIAAHI